MSRYTIHKPWCHSSHDGPCVQEAEAAPLCEHCRWPEASHRNYTGDPRGPCPAFVPPEAAPPRCVHPDVNDGGVCMVCGAWRTAPEAAPPRATTPEPISAELVEQWKRMSWGHYNAPVSRMLNELTRLATLERDAALGVVIREAIEAQHGTGSLLIEMWVMPPAVTAHDAQNNPVARAAAKRLEVEIARALSPSGDTEKSE